MHFKLMVRNIVCIKGLHYSWYHIVSHFMFWHILYITTTKHPDFNLTYLYIEGRGCIHSSYLAFISKSLASSCLVWLAYTKRTLSKIEDDMYIIRIVWFYHDICRQALLLSLRTCICINLGIHLMISLCIIIFWTNQSRTWYGWCLSYQITIICICKFGMRTRYIIVILQYCTYT